MHPHVTKQQRHLKIWSKATKREGGRTMGRQITRQTRENFNYGIVGEVGAEQRVDGTKAETEDFPRSEASLME